MGKTENGNGGSGASIGTQAPVNTAGSEGVPAAALTRVPVASVR